MQGPEEFLQLLRVVVLLLLLMPEESDQVSSSQKNSHGMSCMFWAFEPLASFIGLSGLTEGWTDSPTYVNYHCFTE